MRTESSEKQSKRLKVSSCLTRGNICHPGPLWRLTIFQTDQASSQSSVRIRDNQRRSRARRKEYVQELEQRLQKFQAEGVRATREVQEAGQKMAVENSLLRSLLTLHGVSDRRVEEYLKTHTTHTSSSHSNAALARLQSRQSPRPRPFNDPSPKQNVMAPTSVAPSWSPTIDQQVAVPVDQSQSSEGDSELDVPFDSPGPGPSALQPPNRHVDYIQSGQCTPCETAAGIISSMRSYPDMQEVRSELGCQSSASCMVKNMDIFQLLNER